MVQSLSVWHGNRTSSTDLALSCATVNSKMKLGSEAVDQKPLSQLPVRISLDSTQGKTPAVPPYSHPTGNSEISVNLGKPQNFHSYILKAFSLQRDLFINQTRSVNLV